MFRLRRPSGSMVVACTALFVALGGGAYAATQVPDHSISHPKLTQNSVWHANIGHNSVWHNNIGYHSVWHSNIGNNSVWHANIGKGSVQQNNLSSSIQSQLAAHATPAPSFNYEADNGTNWGLSNMPLALANSKKGYEDAGIVTDIGPASQFNGITKSGSSNLKDNIWITDGAGAFAPGMHVLSAGADFSYGIDNGNGTFAMQSGPHKGETLTLSQIKQDFAGYQAYAWVGITGNGTTSSTGNVSAVNGKNLTANLTVDQTTAAVSG